MRAPPSLINHFYPSNPSFSYEALRALSYANYSGADVGEVIQLCAEIPAGDEAAWTERWSRAASAAEAHACASLDAKNPVSASEGFLKAANYYRTAGFFRRENPTKDAVGERLAKKAVECFDRAMEHTLECRYEHVEIAYEDEKNLQGIFFAPAGEAKAGRPTILFNGGYDSTKEEAWFAIAAAAVKRGFNVLAFDGPGQGAALRELNLHFRPDWEAVVRPVVDYALSRKDVDSKKLVLFGWSMGGYLAARAAAFEDRLAALILDDGVYDFGSAFRQTMPGWFNWLIAGKWDTTTGLMVAAGKRLSTGMKWGLLNGMWTFGADSAPAFLRMVQAYTLQDVCTQITAKTLVLDAPHDHFLRGQPRLLFDKLQCEKKFISVTEAEGGATHCHMGAFLRLHQVIFDFLLGEVV